MADATVIINRWTGVAPGAKTRVDNDPTAGRLATSDAAQPGSANPIPIVAAATKRSFWAHFRLQVTANPDTHTINNLKWFTDGGNGFGTGVTMTAAKASTGADAGYRQGVGVVGDSGTQLTQANHTGLDAAQVNAFTFTSGAPLAITGSTAGTGDLGDFVAQQIDVVDTASPGITPSETMTFQYDEA